MSWDVELRGKKYNTDQLTLAELQAIEDACDVPWATSNPLHSLPEAKAYLIVFAVRDGMTEDEIVDWFAGMTLADIKASFAWDAADLAKVIAMMRAESGDPPPLEASRDTPNRATRRAATTSKRGSAGRPTGTAGDPETPAANASTT